MTLWVTPRRVSTTGVKSNNQDGTWTNPFLLHKVSMGPRKVNIVLSCRSFVVL